MTHSSRRGGAPTTHKKINKQTNRELHAVEAQTKVRSWVIMLNREGPCRGRGRALSAQGNGLCTCYVVTVLSF